jgi:hypothetical protein
MNKSPKPRIVAYNARVKNGLVCIRVNAGHKSEQKAKSARFARRATTYENDDIRACVSIQDRVLVPA